MAQSRRITWFMLLGMMGFQLSLLNHSSSSLAFTVRHHDNHHLLGNVNFGFPLPFMDILHGTFHGNVNIGKTSICIKKGTSFSCLLKQLQRKEIKGTSIN